MFVTTTSCAPAEPAPVVHVIDVDDATVTEVHATPPTLTDAPDKNPVPVTVNDVPPIAGPATGPTDKTVGGGFTMIVPGT